MSFEKRTKVEVFEVRLYCRTCQHRMEEQYTRAPLIGYSGGSRQISGVFVQYYCAHCDYTDPQLHHTSAYPRYAYRQVSE